MATDATAGMVFIPGGTLRHGLGPAAARGALHPRRARRRLLDRPPRGDERAVQTLRRRDRLRDARRARARPQDASRRQRGPARPRLGRLSSQPTKVERSGSDAQWWQYVKGANWREPEGPGSTIAGRENHPVVHVAYEDALAYARWLGRDLPTEAQWEFAARGGSDGRAGLDERVRRRTASPSPIPGRASSRSTTAARTATSAPRRSAAFRPNGYGLYDMIGNVWEWTSDWYRPAIPRSPRSIPSGPISCRSG